MSLLYNILLLIGFFALAVLCSFKFTKAIAEAAVTELTLHIRGEMRKEIASFNIRRYCDERIYRNK